jgi:hypothetical protein
VLRGVDAEQWPVPGGEFVQRYAEFHPSADTGTPGSGNG